MGSNFLNSSPQLLPGERPAWAREHPAFLTVAVRNNWSFFYGLLVPLHFPRPSAASGVQGTTETWEKVTPS